LHGLLIDSFTYTSSKYFAMPDQWLLLRFLHPHLQTKLWNIQAQMAREEPMSLGDLGERGIFYAF